MTDTSQPAELARARGHLDGAEPGHDDLTAAVELLPALPLPDPADRYAIRHVTVLWLAADKTEHTRRAYFADLAAWLSWCDRTDLDPLAARRADVDAWKSTLTVTGSDGTPRPAAPSTVARTLAGVSSWYRYLMSNDIAERNPMAAVNRPKRDKTSPLPALNEDSTAALLNHVDRRAIRNGTEASSRDATLIALLFYTGLRVSGVTGAQVGDLDLESGYTVLRYTGKGGRRDFVPLVEPALRPLERYLELRARRQGRALDRLTGPLLTTTPHHGDGSRPGGKPLRQRDVWNTLRTMARQAGIPAAERISPHTARRTTGTLLLANGVPVQQVQDLLGHADIRTTRDRYDAQRHKLASSPTHTLAEVLADRRDAPRR